MRRARSTGAGRASTARACRRKRGSATGPNPTDRGKAGTERHLVTDARGPPLGLVLTGANCHDSPLMAPTRDAIPPLRSGRRGRPRQRPDKLHADKTCARVRRQECRARGIRSRIARRGIERSDRLGRHLLVVERSHAWFNRARRLPVRYERRADIYEAFTVLQVSLITLNQILRFC